MSVDADRIVTAAMTELRADGFKVDEAAAQAPIGTTGKSGLELNLKAIADAVVDEFTEHWTGGGSWGNLPDGDGVPQRVGDVWSMVQDFLTKTAADALYATTSALSTVATSAASALATATTAAAAAAAAMAAIPAAASTAPLMDGAVSMGTLSAYARADHRHPTDTSREAVIAAGAAGQWWRYDKTWATLSASDVGGLGALATLSQVADAQVADGAAIAWSKISKTGATAADVGALGATAAASGDLAGNYPSPTVAGLRGYVLPTLSATAGGLRWSGMTWALDSTAYLSTTVAAATYQAKLTTGTTAQYLRGDLSLATFPTTVSSFSNDSGYITSAGSISGNAATATKLATARTIAVTGDGTWSVSFDGSANVSSALTVSGLRGYALPTLSSTAGGLRWSGTAWALDSTAYLSTTVAASVYLPLSGGIMAAGAMIKTLQDMTINTGSNANYVTAPFVAQRYSSSGTTTHASIGFHNQGVNGAALYYSSQYANFWYNDHLGGNYHLWDNKDFGNPDYFVQGSNSSRTTQCTGSVTSSSQTLKSGFYDSYNWTDAPVPGSLAHLIHTQYSNDGGTYNNWSFDIAANFAGSVNNGENYYVRTRADGTTGAWRTLIHSANYPSFNNFSNGIITGNGVYRAYAGSNTSFGSIYASGVTPAALNYVLAWEPNGNTSYLNGITSSFMCVSGTPIVTASASGITVAGTITGNLAGTATNSTQLGGVLADYFVQGNGSSAWGHRTTNIGSLSQGLQSGFYDSVDASTPTGSWCHMIVNAHTGSGSGNQYQWELAGGFWNEDIYSRRIAAGAATTWRTLLHSGNYPSYNNFTSGLITPTITTSSSLQIISPSNIYLNNGNRNYAQLSASAFSLTTALNTNGYGIHANDLIVDTIASIGSNLTIGGALGLATVRLTANTDYNSNNHKGRIVYTDTNYQFDINTMVAGDWCILCGVGYIVITSGNTYFRGATATSNITRLFGSLLCMHDGTRVIIG